MVGYPGYPGLSRRELHVEGDLVSSLVVVLVAVQCGYLRWTSWNGHLGDQKLNVRH